MTAPNVIWAWAWEGNPNIGQWEAQPSIVGGGIRYIRADAPELVAIMATMRKMREGWANALELGLIPERHRASAQILRDDAADAIAAYEALK